MQTYRKMTDISFKKTNELCIPVRGSLQSVPICPTSRTISEAPIHLVG